MEINDAIFDAVKSNLVENNNNLVMKICLGTATEEEKEEFKNLTDFPEENLKEFCNVGYNFAEQVDLKEQLNNLTEQMNIFKDEMNKFKEEFKEEINKFKDELRNK